MQLSMFMTVLSTHGLGGRQERQHECGSYSDQSFLSHGVSCNRITPNQSFRHPLLSQPMAMAGESSHGGPHPSGPWGRPSPLAPLESQSRSRVFGAERT